MERSRSGEAWASCSCRNWVGSILLGAVTAWSPGRSTVRGFLQDHAVAAYTRLRPSPGRPHHLDGRHSAMIYRTDGGELQMTAQPPPSLRSEWRHGRIFEAA